MLDIEQAENLLKDYFSGGKRVRYDRKSILIPYDSRVDRAYFIEEGYVKVASHSAKGSERIHYLYGPGDFFPVTWFFGDVSVRVEFAAFTNVVALTKPAADTDKFFQSNPLSLAAIIHQQASIYNRIINLNMGSAEHRVAYSIQALRQRFGKHMNGQSVIEIPITLQDIANMVRLTRESAGKAMADLEHEGCLHVGRRNIIVYPERLKEFAEE